MENLKRKRAESLTRAVVGLIKKRIIDKSKYALNAAVLNKVVEHYSQDLEILKKRYGIPGKANMPKIAGLMAYSIVKFKPLAPVPGAKLEARDLSANEWLAIYYGLCVCADIGGGHVDENGLLGLIVSNPFFEEWFRNFKYLLEERNYTAESLIMIFGTLGFVFQNSHEAEA
jgi:hypothetical protein